MSSRQEEKERRRQERLAAEQEAARREASKQRLQWVGGGLLAVVAVAVLIAFVIVPAVGGGDGGSSEGKGPTTTAVEDAPPIPPQVNTDLQSSVKAAGCTAQTFPSEGRQHDAKPTSWQYKTNPPTSGTHDPTAAEDGIYPYREMPSVGMTTHSLEHGRINIQYGPQVTRQQYAQLATLVNEQGEGFHQLLFRNQTKMPFAVAATAWTQLLGCETFNPKVFDAIRNFRERYTDRAPEPVP